MSDLLDDVWGSDSDALSPHESQDLKKLEEHHYKRGYVDGISGSKEANLQDGFDEAFPLGSYLGMEVGKLMGVMQCLNFKYGHQDEELHQDFQLAQKELRINKILTKSMFDTNLALSEEHAIIAKWKSIVKVHCNKYSINVK